MEENGNALVVAGESVEASEHEIELIMQSCGSTKTHGGYSNLALLMRAKQWKSLKDGKAYRSLGMTWDDFCSQKLGMNRKNVDEHIKKLPEYLALVMADRKALPGANGHDFEDGEITDLAGNKVALNSVTKQDLQTLLQAARAEAQAEREQRMRAEQEGTKVRNKWEAEQSRAKALKEEVERLERAIEQGFDELTPNQKALRKAQAYVSALVMRLIPVRNAERSEIEDIELRGFVDYAITQIIDASGYNPIDEATFNTFAPRNLVAEYAEEKSAAKKGRKAAE